MILQKKTAALLAAMMLSGSLTACVFEPGGNSVTEPTPELVTTAALSEETAAPAAETTLPAAETDPPVAENDEIPAVCGKWEAVSVGENTIYAGQYGSEEYRRMFQMELFPDGSAEYYERGTEFCAEGTWSFEDNVLHLSFIGGAHLAPLCYLTPDADDGYTLTFEGDTLTGEAEYLGALVYSRTDSFTERQYPDVAWLSGNWVCDEEKSSAENPPAPLSQFRWEIYTVEQSVCASISDNGGESYEFYFGQIQPDGSFRLAVDYLEDKGYPYVDSVISRDGDEAKWEINFNGYGTVYMKKAQ